MAFEADGQLWEFICMPFGLRNSLAAFNCALRNIIGDLPGVVIYLDDMVIGGQDLDEHNHNLQTFLNCASEVNLQLSKEKCAFRGTSFLGHLIKNGSISLDPNRLAPFVDFTIPTMYKQLERFIGLQSTISNGYHFLARLWTHSSQRYIQDPYHCAKKPLKLYNR